MQSFNELNVTNRVRERMHDIIRQHVNGDFPSYWQAVNLVKTAAHNPINYPVCVKDCTVYRQPLGAIAGDDLEKLRCSVCNELYATVSGPSYDRKVTCKKVRLAALTTRPVTLNIRF